MKRHKRTKELQFSKETIVKICERDRGCIFCNMNFHMESKFSFDYEIMDIMHIVPKSQGGLGIMQNGVQGCRYHHSLFDNGNKGLHQEMKDRIIRYISEYYPDWNEENMKYKKYGGNLL